MDARETHFGECPFFFNDAFENFTAVLCESASHRAYIFAEPIVPLHLIPERSSKCEICA
jgi:hypothetical protein